MGKAVDGSVDFESLARALADANSVPDGAFTSRSLAEKSGASIDSVQRMLRELVADGKLVRGGPRGIYYWPPS